ncbi:hypothetical protein CRG98_015819 [Punica granatum]|uniref:DUF8040 domain-containing protein n=1 Tax=Punica granatum TaxID=22663 RepID=A0A2I0K5L0_PUNGR|nr:hypothetical protein CRG98_015819 [Punica granatum]
MALDLRVVNIIGVQLQYNIPRNSNSARFDSSSNDDEIIIRQRWFFLLMVQLLEFELVFQRNIPCRTSALQGRQYTLEVLGNDVRCFESYRMEPYVFRNLCDTLRLHCGITDSRNGITVEEMVGRVRHMIQEYFPKLLHWTNFQCHVVDFQTFRDIWLYTRGNDITEVISVGAIHRQQRMSFLISATH